MGPIQSTLNNLGVKLTLLGRQISGGVSTSLLQSSGSRTRVVFPILGETGSDSAIEGNLESSGISPTNGAVSVGVSYDGPKKIIVVIEEKMYVVDLTLSDTRQILAVTSPDNMMVSVSSPSDLLVAHVNYSYGIEFTLPIRVSNPSIPIVLNPSLTVAYGMGGTLELRTPTGDCPKIKVLYNLDPIYGGNLALAVFRTESLDGKVQEHIHRPKLTSVVGGNGCTLQDKTQDLDVNINSVVSYGLLRYYLWYLITGRWDIHILYQDNTRKFFRKLSVSGYKCWVEAFDDPRIKGYDKYYL